MKKYRCQTCEKAWYSAAELRICPDCHEELKEEADAYLLEM
jgi:predicted amidophosphoribosyltransferase